MFTQIYNICQPFLQNSHGLGMEIGFRDHQSYSLFSVPQKSQPYNHLRDGYIPIVPKLVAGTLQPMQYQSSPFLGMIYPDYVNG